MPWDQTTHPKIAMPMTAASVAQRRMGFKAPRAQKYEGQSPYLVSQGFSRGGSDEKKKRGAILLWIQQGGVYGHSDGRSPNNGREPASKGRSVGLTSAHTHQGRAQGADQAPLAAIARVSAAKSEAWILVLCLRMYSIKGVLTRGTNEETGSQVSWDGP